MKLLKAELENESSDKLIKMIEALRESAKLNDKLFAVLLHDLVSPISAISSLSKFIISKDNNLNNEEIIDANRAINQSSNSVLELINNTMQILKYQSGQIHFNKLKFQISNLINESLNLLNLNINNKQIKINMLIPDEIRINTDSNIFITLLRNLISNAIKYSYEKGEIEIGLKSSPNQNHIVLYVKDYGVGMDADKINSFLKEGPTFSSKGTLNEEGTGIGLYFCQELAKKNGGDIWVESKEDFGTTFFVSFTKV
jgi:two-component system sensor histidine kinase/response regulator